jgi:hypothetical protein
MPAAAPGSGWLPITFCISIFTSFFFLNAIFIQAPDKPARRYPQQRADDSSCQGKPINFNRFPPPFTPFPRAWIPLHKAFFKMTVIVPERPMTTSLHNNLYYV